MYVLLSTLCFPLSFLLPSHPLQHTVFMVKLYVIKQMINKTLLLDLNTLPYQGMLGLISAVNERLK